MQSDMDAKENKEQFALGFKDVQESFYDLCSKLEKTQTALEDSRLREKELREELAQTEDARQSTFDKYVELKQKYADIKYKLRSVMDMELAPTPMFKSKKQIELEDDNDDDIMEKNTRRNSAKNDSKVSSGRASPVKKLKSPLPPSSAKNSLTPESAKIPPTLTVGETKKKEEPPTVKAQPKADPKEKASSPVPIPVKIEPAKPVKSTPPDATEAECAQPAEAAKAKKLPSRPDSRASIKSSVSTTESKKSPTRSESQASVCSEALKKDDTSPISDVRQSLSRTSSRCKTPSLNSPDKDKAPHEPDEQVSSPRSTSKAASRDSRPSSAMSVTEAKSSSLSKMSSRKSSARSRKSALSSRASSRLEGENTPADTNEAEAEQEPMENKDQESRISDAVEE